MSDVDWSEEILHDGMRVRLSIDSLIFDSRTDHQRLVLFENCDFGRVLTLDSIIQTTEADEFIYSEMLSHVPILAHGAVRKVLIIGGGDGGVARRVLMHSGVEKVTMVEIDPGVVEFSREHLSSICGDAFDDPRFDLVIDDGARFVATTPERYDVIITDSTDPVGPGEVLFTQSYYADCRRCMADGGVLVTQNGVPFLQKDELRASMTALRALFADVTCYMAAVPSYVGGAMAFGWASDNRDLRNTDSALLAACFKSAGLETRYYTPDIHKAAFVLPPYMIDLMNS